MLENLWYRWYLLKDFIYVDIYGWIINMPVNDEKEHCVGRRTGKKKKCPECAKNS